MTRVGAVPVPPSHSRRCGPRSCSLRPPWGRVRDEANDLNHCIAPGRHPGHLPWSALPAGPARSCTGALQAIGPPGLAKGEAVGLSARVGEGDLEGAVGNGAGLTEELVCPLLREGAGAVSVGVGPVGLAGWLSVDTDA